MIRKGPILAGLIGALVAGGVLMVLRWTVFAPTEATSTPKGNESSGREGKIEVKNNVASPAPNLEKPATNSFSRVS